LDRKRKKRTSNKEWKSPVDEDARVAKMKDGRTHLAHKAEHAVDLDSGAVVAVTLQAADKGDTATMDETLIEAGMAVAELAVHQSESHSGDTKVNIHGIEELVADKGYLSGAVLKRVKSYGVRSYIPEKRQKGKRRWQDKAEEQQAVYENRRRVRGDYGQRGRENILKRQLAHVSAFNLSLVMRQLLGAGTPRELKNRATRLVLRTFLLLIGRNRPKSAVEPRTRSVFDSPEIYRETRTRCRMTWHSVTCTTGC
jgi:transposase